MIAGVAGGVAGAAVAKLSASTCAGSLSSWGGDSEGSIGWGGCGKRDSEKVEAVGVVCAPLERERSVENLDTAGGGDSRGWVDFTFASGGGKGTGSLAIGGFGNLFLDLN
jgi:hypothetical protein